MSLNTPETSQRWKINLYLTEQRSRINSALTWSPKSKLFLIRQRIARILCFLFVLGQEEESNKTPFFISFLVVCHYTHTHILICMDAQHKYIWMVLMDWVHVFQTLTLFFSWWIIDILPNECFDYLLLKKQQNQSLYVSSSSLYYKTHHKSDWFWIAHLTRMSTKDWQS